MLRKQGGVVNQLTFTADDVAGALEHLRKHEVELIHQQPLFVEKPGSRLASLWEPDGEKSELFSPCTAPSVNSIVRCFSTRASVEPSASFVECG